MKSKSDGVQEPRPTAEGFEEPASQVPNEQRFVSAIDYLTDELEQVALRPVASGPEEERWMSDFEA